MQKCSRDRHESLLVTDVYYRFYWFVIFLSIALMVIGLWNATLLTNEKGFFALAFLFGILELFLFKRIQEIIW